MTSRTDNISFTPPCGALAGEICLNGAGRASPTNTQGAARPSFRPRAWNRAHADRIKAAHRRFERSPKRREYLNGRGREARRMTFKLKDEIRAGRFPRPARCVFSDQTCYGAVIYAHLAYDRWDNVMPMCRSHHSRFDHGRPKTLPVKARKNVAA